MMNHMNSIPDSFRILELKVQIAEHFVFLYRRMLNIFGKSAQNENYKKSITQATEKKKLK